MSSRAASAATSRRAKQELVRLLIGTTARSETTNAIAPGSLDYSRCSYSELKTAYRKVLQELHPDRHYSRRDTDPDSTRHCRFIELQNAWDQYEQVAKLGKLGDNRNGDNQLGTFTQFGVGCSFSDTEEERTLRAEYTDQACRGWFSAGALAPSAGSSGKQYEDTAGAPKAQIPLISEDMFVSIENLNGDTKPGKKWPKGRPPSLVKTR